MLADMQALLDEPVHGETVVTLKLFGMYRQDNNGRQVLR